MQSYFLFFICIVENAAMKKKGDCHIQLAKSTQLAEFNYEEMCTWCISEYV